ncbi:hypothetical protein BDA99DRAFT_544624 [Phascolomyces articulosus]|uniref:Uncharacterized protein n=1 Tax=Phascolomyces articulosus TaxID=60185 RepID=A0AAD5JK17_9FUNG|nr:hypothetical protein BDA99DRAFT_544624 [Phascolomyces articulosus]
MSSENIDRYFNYAENDACINPTCCYMHHGLTTQVLLSQMYAREQMLIKALFESTRTVLSFDTELYPVSSRVMAKLMEQYRNRDFAGELEEFLSEQAVNGREDLAQKKEEYRRLLEEKKQIERDLKDAWPEVAVYDGPTAVCLIKDQHQQIVHLLEEKLAHNRQDIDDFKTTALNTYK